jgi:hypothetical protein
LGLLIVFGPIVGPDTAQPASRYSLTASIAEHGTVDLGRYRHRLGVDHAIYNGHLRSDKAPGQPLLAVPVYLSGRAVGAQSATQARERGDLGLWWVTLWSSTVPFVMLVALMFLLAERYAGRSAALAVALLFGLTTMMLPLAVNLYGHSLSALFGFGAWFVIDRTPMTGRRAVASGLLAGAAVLTEYQSGIVLLVLAGYMVVRERKRVGWFVLGAAVPLAVLGWYQSIAFGAPWRTPSAYYAGTINGTSEGGYTLPDVHALWSILFGKRGVLIGAPVAFVALVAAVWLVVSGAGAARRHAIVALAIVIPYLVLCAGWSGLALLEEPGPRYLIPALPFLAVPLAVMWGRLWQPALLFAVWGAVIAVPAAFTFFLLGIGQPAFPELARRFAHGQFLPTIWSMGLGRFGVIIYAVSVVAAVILFARLLDLRVSSRTRQGV